MKLKELFDIAKASSKSWFNENGKHPPMFYVYSPMRSELGLISAVWSTTEEKFAVTAKVREWMATNSASQYVFVTEMWMTIMRAPHGATRETALEMAKHITPPSQNPDRQEKLWMAGESKTESMLAGYYDIIRPKVGRVRVGNWNDWSNDEHGGSLPINAFADMLGPKSASH